MGKRADNYGWFYGGDKYNHNNDGSKATWDNINFVWDDFAKSMEDASVTVDIHRAERSVVLKYNIVDNKDNSKVYSLRNTIELLYLNNMIVSKGYWDLVSLKILSECILQEKNVLFQILKL